MTTRQQFDKILTSYAVCVAATSLGVIVCQCAGLSEVRFFDVFFANIFGAHALAHTEIYLCSLQAGQGAYVDGLVALFHSSRQSHFGLMVRNMLSSFVGKAFADNISRTNHNFQMSFAQQVFVAAIGSTSLGLGDISVRSLRSFRSHLQMSLVRRSLDR